MMLVKWFWRVNDSDVQQLGWSSDCLEKLTSSLSSLPPPTHHCPVCPAYPTPLHSQTLSPIWILHACAPITKTQWGQDNSGWKSGPVGCCCYPGRILSPHSSAPRSDQRSPRRRGRKWWRIIHWRRSLLDSSLSRIHTLLLLLLASMQPRELSQFLRCCCCCCSPSQKAPERLCLDTKIVLCANTTWVELSNMPCFCSKEPSPIVSSP